MIDTIGWRPKGWILIYPLKGGAKAERVEHWDKMETEKFIERPLEVVDVDAKVVDWIKAGGLKMFVNNQRGEGHPTINTVDLVDRETGRKLREPQ